MAGIIVVDYYVLRRDRAVLDASRAKGELPAFVDKWNPVALIVWLAAFLIGQFVTVGIPAINSLLSAGLLYYLVMKAIAAARKTEKVEFERTSVVS